MNAGMKKKEKALKAVSLSFSRKAKRTTCKYDAMTLCFQNLGFSISVPALQKSTRGRGGGLPVFASEQFRCGKCSKCAGMAGVPVSTCGRVGACLSLLNVKLYNSYTHGSRTPMGELRLNA